VSIPLRPSLEFDRQQAKALLDALRRGDSAAARRFREHHPRFGPGGTERGAALHDAQLVIAREYGFASWPRWKQFVEAHGLDARGRAAELVRAACAGDMRRASMLLDLEPELERFDLYAACACGTVAPTTRPAGGATSRRREYPCPQPIGGDALGCALHGSVNCHDPRGGMTMKLPEEITHGDYPAVADLLIAAGARLPARDAGSEAVQDVLRRAGVPDPD